VDGRRYISKVIKPSLRLTELSRRSLRELIEDLKFNDPDEKEDILRHLESVYGGKALANQPEAVSGILEALEGSRGILIFDFSRITHPQTRINIAGLIMQEIFNRSKRDSRERLVVLEEAHNFAPERGFGDVSAGRDNLSLTAAAQVSKYVLSQMNTQAMFRTINASDIDAISTLIEHAGEDIVGTLPRLPTGAGVLSGVGVPFPVVVRVR